MLTNRFSLRSLLTTMLMVAALSMGGLLNGAQAETITISNATSVSELQALIAQLQARLNEMTKAGGGTGTSVTTKPSSCAVFTRTLALGATDATTGGEVTRLQERLTASGHFTYGKPTGFFGPATAEALQRWQAANGIVSSGTPDSTGFGMFGPSSRAKLNAACTPVDTVVKPGTGTPSTPDGVKCMSDGAYYGEGTKKTTIVVEGSRRTVSDGSFVCRSGEWKVEGSLPAVAVPDSEAATCVSGSILYKEGTKKSTIVVDGNRRTISDAYFVCRSGEWKVEGSLSAVDEPAATTCLSGTVSYKEGTKRTSITTNAGTRVISDGYFVCRSGEWKVEGSLPSVDTPVVSGCQNAGVSYPEGTSRTSLTNTDGSTRTISDGTFVCRSGEWKVEGTSTPVTPPATTSCFSGGEYFSEGTSRTSITNLDGSRRVISDGTFVCRNGSWEVEGSLPTAPSVPVTGTPTFTASVSGLTATLRFSIPNSCAGYTLTWGNGMRTVRTAATAGTMCTQAVVNLEKSHTYAAAGTYAVTLTRFSGSTQTDTYTERVTVTAPSTSVSGAGYVRGAATTELEEVMKELVSKLELLAAKLGE